MSAKQAKRARQAARLRGEVPRVDAKRAERNAQYEADQQRREEAERFRREHPEEYQEQQRLNAARARRLLNTISAVVGFIGTGYPR